MISNSIQIAIINEVHVEDILQSILYENGIVEIIWDTQIEIIEIQHLKHVQQSISFLGNKAKMPIFFTAHEFLTVSEEARVFAASEEGIVFTLANAVLIDSLPKKILFNFFLKFNRPISPTKGFRSREEAFNWLQMILNDSKGL